MYTENLLNVECGHHTAIQLSPCDVHIVRKRKEHKVHGDMIGDLMSECYVRKRGGAIY